MSDATLKPPDDPNHEWNSSRYHTGRECIADGCKNPAGTVWSLYWCQRCNAARLRRISEKLEAIVAAKEVIDDN